jgi:hypothetical protein
MDRIRILSWLIFIIFGFCSSVCFSQRKIATDSINLPNLSTFSSFNTYHPTLFNTGSKSGPTFNAHHLPLFCKIEHQIEKSSKIAFRFRLGDLNYVNMLENK